MRKFREQAEITTSALLRSSSGPSGQIDVRAVADIIEQTLHEAAREQEKRELQRIAEVQESAHAAPVAPAQRLAGGHLLPGGERRLRAHLRERKHSPPVWLHASRVSRRPLSLARSRSPRRRRTHQCVGRQDVRKRRALDRIPHPPRRRQLLLGQRSAAGRARREGRAHRDRRLMDRYHQAQGGRGRAGDRALAAYPLIGCGPLGDLQLRRLRRFCTHFRQRQHRAHARL